jgi:hypothetical protein
MISSPSFRGVPKVRTLNPTTNSEGMAGFRGRRGACHRAGRRPDPVAPSRNDDRNDDPELARSSS